MANSSVMAVLTRDTQVQKSPSNYFRHLHRFRSHHLMCMSRLLWTNKKIKVQSLPCQMRAKQWRLLLYHRTLFHISRPVPIAFPRETNETKIVFLNGTKITISDWAYFVQWMPVSTLMASHNAKWVRSEQNAQQWCFFPPSSMLYIVHFPDLAIPAKSNKRRLNGSAK